MQYCDIAMSILWHCHVCCELSVTLFFIFNISTSPFSSLLLTKTPSFITCFVFECECIPETSQTPLLFLSQTLFSCKFSSIFHCNYSNVILFVNVTLFFLGRWGTHTTYSVNRYFSLLIVYPAGFDSGAWLPKPPIFGDLKIRFMLFMSYDRTFSP